MFSLNGTQEEEGKAPFLITLSLVLATNLRLALLLSVHR